MKGPKNWLVASYIGCHCADIPHRLSHLNECNQSEDGHNCCIDQSSGLVALVRWGDPESLSGWWLVWNSEEAVSIPVVYLKRYLLRMIEFSDPGKI